jgi:hypothetical protein
MTWRSWYGISHTHFGSTCHTDYGYLCYPSLCVTLTIFQSQQRLQIAPCVLSRSLYEFLGCDRPNVIFFFGPWIHWDRRYRDFMGRLGASKYYLFVSRMPTDSGMVQNGRAICMCRMERTKDCMQP